MITCDSPLSGTFVKVEKDKDEKSLSFAEISATGEQQTNLVNIKFSDGVEMIFPKKALAG